MDHTGDEKIVLSLKPGKPVRMIDRTAVTAAGMIEKRFP